MCDGSMKTAADLNFMSNNQYVIPYNKNRVVMRNIPKTLAQLKKLAESEVCLSNNLHDRFKDDRWNPWETYTEKIVNRMEECLEPILGRKVRNKEVSAKLFMEKEIRELSKEGAMASLFVEKSIPFIKLFEERLAKNELAKWYELEVLMDFDGERKRMFSVKVNFDTNTVEMSQKTPTDFSWNKGAGRWICGYLISKYAKCLVDYIEKSHITINVPMQRRGNMRDCFYNTEIMPILRKEQVVSITFKTKSKEYVYVDTNEDNCMVFIENKPNASIKNALFLIHAQEVRNALDALYDCNKYMVHGYHQKTVAINESQNEALFDVGKIRLKTV